MLFASLVTAAATATLTIVTWIFVHITKNAAERQTALSEAELFRNLVTEYSDPEMSDALIYVERWWRDHGDGEELTKAARKWAEDFNHGPVDPNSSDWALHDARRKVAHWHRKVMAFGNREYLNPELVSELKRWSAKGIVLGVLRELELAHAEEQHREGGREYAEQVYDQLRKFFERP